MKRKMVSALLCATMVAGMVVVPAATAQAADKKVIGVTMPTKDLQRWNQDGENMKKELEAAGYEVDLQYASNDVSTQVSQLENQVANGCDLLVVASIDGSSLGEPLKQAKEKGIPVISYAQNIKIEGENVIVERQFDDRYHVLKAKMPCLITALGELNEPRYMTPGGIFDAYKKEITVWGRADLKDVDDSNLGLKGSPTQIAKASDKVRKGAGEKFTFDTPDEAASFITGKLQEKHVI